MTRPEQCNLPGLNGYQGYKLHDKLCFCVGGGEQIVNARPVNDIVVIEIFNEAK